MQPDLILVPFAQDAPAVNVDAIPISLGPSDPPQAASWSQGFPTVTMTPLAAGGIPPRGQSFNGVLQDITQHLVYIGGGGQYKWSSAYVTAKGGYSIGDVIQADNGLLSYVSLVNNNTANFNTDPSSIGPSWRAWAGGSIPNATTDQRGVVVLATQAQVNSGTGDAVVTPATMKVVTDLKMPISGGGFSGPINAPEMASGQIKASFFVESPSFEVRAIGGQPYMDFSNDETADYDVRFIQNGATTVDVRSAGVPLTINGSRAVTVSMVGTEADVGVSKVATSAKAVAGTDDVDHMTALKTKQAITALAPSYATESAPGVMQIATNAQAVAGTNDTASMTPLKTKQLLDASTPAQASVRGLYSNLKMSASGTSRIVTITCDEIVLEDASNNYVTARDVGIAGDTTTVGAGGLDTGILQANTWYSVWVIAGAGPYAFLMSLSATSPTMPSGWSRKGRVGWIRTDGSANKFPLAFIQYGSKVRYLVDPGSNVTGLPPMASGIAGNPVTPVWAAVSVSTFVPPTAGFISAVFGVQNGATANLAPNTSYGAWAALSNPPAMSVSCQATMFSTVIRSEIALESSNLYWNSDTATSRLYCAGWEDNL